MAIFSSKLNVPESELALVIRQIFWEVHKRPPNLTLSDTGPGSL
ncbi:MAG: hypothetical protein QXO71_02405 [Candidatus Jordarchaeaceae archaeon]